MLLVPDTSTFRILPPDYDEGIRKKIEPGDPIEENVYNLTLEQKRNYNIRSLPASLKDALDALQSDKKFLEHVFTDDFIAGYSSMYSEYNAFAQTPTTWEISMYADI